MSTNDEPMQKKCAIIVGVLFQNEDSSLLEVDLSELEALLDTLGIKVLKKVVQKRQRPAADLLLGSGKVDEIRELAEQLECDLVVFDRGLSAQQNRNLEDHLCRKVMDRPSVILDIFAKHAKTKQAKLQVEIAKLEYMLPRLTGAWTHFQRQTGGRVRARGMGEKQIEVDRRRARARIASLAKQLVQVAKSQDIQRKGRRSELRVSLVGYTNSGKTTLMKALTKAPFAPQDALFATLDSAVRMLDPTTRPKILLSDTVGFIRNLPHGLIESFKSTLNEVVEADLLLHVVDVSQSNYRLQIETTEAVLEEIGAGDRPSIMIFNKVDKLDEKYLEKLLKQSYPDSFFMSAYDLDAVIKLREKVYSFFESNFVEAQLAIPDTDQQALSVVHQCCLILNVGCEGDGLTWFKVKVPRSKFPKLEQYQKA